MQRLSDQLTEAYYLRLDKRVLRRVAELSELYGGEIPLAQEQLAELAGPRGRRRIASSATWSAEGSSSFAGGWSSLTRTCSSAAARPR